MNYLILGKKIIFEEGIINYLKRKLNITYLDNKTVYTINYNNHKTKILLNRQFGHVDLKIFSDGIYEKEIVDDIRAVLAPDKNFIDIGANIGQHSLLLSRYAKAVYSFEPIPIVFQQFSKSIRLNHIKNIHPFNLAVGEKKESKKFNFVTTHAGTSSFVERENKNTNYITVHTDTLQNIIPSVKLDVMKIDVEGYEAVVVLGNKEKILHDRPTIFIEVNPTWIEKQGEYKTEELLDFFHQNEFEIYSRNEKRILNREDFDLKTQDNLIISPKSTIKI